MYLNTTQAAAFCLLSRDMLEVLLRDPKSKFPRPFQPAGPHGRRAFKQSELEAWLESRRAKYPVKQAA